ncbi:MAG: hypothetical protein WCE79_08460 [Xanthobacteraceae bacterium]
MQAFWDRIKASLSADDLFFRVSCFFYALVGGAVGGFIAWLLVASSARETTAGPLYALFWLIAVAFLVWAAVLLIGCVSPPGTRPMRWAAATLPPIVSFDGQEGLLAYITFLPAAVLTLLLRGIGVRGCQSRRSAALIDEAERNSRSTAPRIDV